MIETTLIVRMLAVDPFEAHRRRLPRGQYRISVAAESCRRYPIPGPPPPLSQRSELRSARRRLRLYPLLRALPRPRDHRELRRPGVTRECILRGSPNGAPHPRPQAGRNRPEWVVAINRNAWSQSIGTACRDHPVRAACRQDYRIGPCGRVDPTTFLPADGMLLSAAACALNDFPLARLESRLKCPRCGSRRCLNRRALKRGWRASGAEAARRALNQWATPIGTDQSGRRQSRQCVGSISCRPLIPTASQPSAARRTGYANG